jgi:Arc/MetJ family transcription regulator
MTVAIEVDDDLVQAVIRKYRLAGRSEAVHLALRNLLGEGAGGHLDDDDELQRPGRVAPAAAQRRQGLVVWWRCGPGCNLF